MKTPDIFVVSLGNPERMHTIKTLNDARIPYVVVVHDKAAAARIRSAGGLPCIIVTIEAGTTMLWQKRNWILDTLVPKGSWYISLDDNIRGFTMVDKKYRDYDSNDTQGPPPRGKTWRELYNVPCTPREWLNELTADIEIADAYGRPLVGVATMENPYFRAKRYSEHRFVKGKAFAMLNTGDLRYKYNVCEDSYMSAQVVAKYGGVLVDSFLHHRTKMYESGGIGDRAAREKLGLLENMQAICDEFPGLVTVGRGENTALKFRLVTDTGVQRWRKEHGYL